MSEIKTKQFLISLEINKMRLSYLETVNFRILNSPNAWDSHILWDGHILTWFLTSCATFSHSGSEAELTLTTLQFPPPKNKIYF